MSAISKIKRIRGVGADTETRYVFLFMTGIYKITSPTGKIYVGQSVNIKRRFYHYKSISCKEQPRLYNSFIKHGVNNHTFEILELCDFHLLNIKERYWQEQFDCTGFNGLNCQLQKTHELKIEVSQETKNKHKKRCGINHPSFGKKRTLEQRQKMSIAQKKIKRKQMSDDTKKKLSVLRTGEKNAMYGKEVSLNHRLKISIANTGKKHTEETKQKLRVKKSDEVKKRMSLNNPNKKKVIDKNTGIIYNSLTELCKFFNLRVSVISRYLNGKRKVNPTSFEYL